MLPRFALLASFALSLWMIRRDRRWRQFSSAALWVPALWLGLGSSRGMSFWLYQLGLVGGGQSNLEGNPVNLVFNSSLFIIAILILIRRRFNWVQYVFANKGLFSLYAFFLCSAAWSPFPVPSVKRWVQEFGWLLIAPIVLTERDPAASLRMVFVRVSYVLFAPSIPFMKYFPAIGRVFSAHGAQMMSGVADHKNSLGQLCFVFCLALIWDLMETRNADTAPSRKPEYFVRLLNLAIGLYLLDVSSSATSLLCFVFGIVLLVVAKHLAAMRNAKRVFILGVLAIVSVLALQQTFHLTNEVSEAFGRGSGMSGRSDIWRVSLQHHNSYLLGTGFRGFWESSDGKATYEELGTGELSTVHNGYIETYLNGGVVGLFFLAIFIWSTGLIATAKLVDRTPIGRLAVVFWPLILVYNLSESQFMMTGPVWHAMLLATTDMPQDHRENALVTEAMPRRSPQLRRLGRDSSAAMAPAAPGTGR